MDKICPKYNILSDPKSASNLMHSSLCQPGTYKNTMVSLSGLPLKLKKMSKCFSIKVKYILEYQNIKQDMAIHNTPLIDSWQSDNFMQAMPMGKLGEKNPLCGNENN